MKRASRSTGNGIRRFLYWLGPTYCILLGALLLVGSFIVQLLTSIGVPYIKAFDFFRFDLSTFQFVELGMWAACTGTEPIIFPSAPQFNEPGHFNCPEATWGWKDLQYESIYKNFFDHNLPKALIFHPISCCFTFFALVCALVTMKRQKSHWLLPIFSLLSCIFALISFFIDVAVFVPARHKLTTPEATDQLGAVVLSTELGPAFWLSLACFCLDIIGNLTILFGYGIWRYQRKSQARRSASSATIDVENGGLSKRARKANRRRGYGEMGAEGDGDEKDEAHEMSAVRPPSSAGTAIGSKGNDSASTIKDDPFSEKVAAAPTLPKSTSRRGLAQDEEEGEHDDDDSFEHQAQRSDRDGDDDDDNEEDFDDARSSAGRSVYEDAQMARSGVSVGAGASTHSVVSPGSPEVAERDEEEERQSQPQIVNYGSRGLNKRKPVPRS